MDLTIKNQYENPVHNIVKDTFEKGKQIIVFVNNKRSAESNAEKIGKLINMTSEEAGILSESILNVLSSPTKQCRRLSQCIKKGVAFHHAGLHSKQRELIEEHFKKGTIKAICATPTLAQGMDLPAFRTLIKDVKRFTGRWGMSFIPVLEYEQMAGRAGRPGKEDYGEAILIAKNKDEKDALEDRYIFGEPEEIISKLAVEPVFRTYVLSLIASGFFNTRKQLYDFFSKSFYALQYGDMNLIKDKIDIVIEKLGSWNLIETISEEKEDFLRGDKYAKIIQGNLKATLLGIRVSQLYLDPLDAQFIISRIIKSEENKDNLTEFGIIHMLCNTLEMTPLLRTRSAEIAIMEEIINERQNELMIAPPEIYSPDYEGYLDSIKTSLLFDYWIKEMTEEFILEKLAVRPGELQAKLDRIDWLLYCVSELAKILSFKSTIRVSNKARVRVKYGVKEELLPLVRFKNIGRVRARKLFNRGIKNVKDVKRVSLNELAGIVGKKISESMKRDAGEGKELEKKESENLKSFQ